MSRIVLSLDLSTTCTGWAVFNGDTGELVTRGIEKPSSKFCGEPISKMTYPKQQLTKMVDLAFKVRTLILNYKPTHIVIEEISGSKNRIGQKTLDGLHWIILLHIQEFISIVTFYDVSGPNGWRFAFGMKLSEADKLANKEAKKLNPKLSKAQQIPIIGWKDLAARHANKSFQLNLDPQLNQSDSDIADAICLGDAYIKYKMPKAV